MKFHWAAGIALWTIISGPAMYGSPAPAARQAVPAPKQAVKVQAKAAMAPRAQR